MENRFTGTGLDRLVEIIETDTGVRRQVTDAELTAGAQAAGELNHLILDGINALGLANDGTIDRADMRGLSDWIRSDAGRFQNYLDLYGRHNANSETGFQLVQNEDSSARIFGEDAIDEVADAIYSLGFGYDGEGRLLDVDGTPYRSLNLTAGWLEDLLSDADMKALKNDTGALIVEGTTGTGLDRVIEIIHSDPGLTRNVSQTDIATASKAVDGLNHLYLDGMRALGLANDSVIDKADVVALSDWVKGDAGRFAEFTDLHTDWLKVLNKGADLATVEGFNDGVHPHIGHVVNHGFRGVYEIGFGAEDGILLNRNGQPDVGARVAGSWFDQLMSAADKQGLANPEGSLIVEATTGTGLDQIVEIINADAGLVRNVSRADITEAATAADAMNGIIAEVIGKLGLDDDGRIDGRDVRAINANIRSDDTLHDEFVFLYGTKTGDDETGFEAVRGDGGGEKLFGKWAVNDVADGVYQVAFDIEKNMFLDAEGDVSYSVARVAQWIDDLYFA